MSSRDSQTVALRATAKSHARDVAELLDSKIVAHRRVSVGAQQYPYKAPFHTDEFWFSVLLSDCTYQFTGTHKRGYAVPARFCLSFKLPYETMLTTSALTSLSQELGVSVYTRNSMPEDVPVAHILSAPTRALLRRIDFSPVRLAFLNASQIQVWSEFIDSRQCAQQVRLFQELLLSVYRSYDALGNA